MDGDGIEDVIVSSPTTNGFPNNLGDVYVINLNANGSIKSRREIGPSNNI